MLTSRGTSRVSALRDMKAASVKQTETTAGTTSVPTEQLVWTESMDTTVSACLDMSANSVRMSPRHVLRSHVTMGQHALARPISSKEHFSHAYAQQDLKVHTAILNLTNAHQILVKMAELAHRGRGFSHALVNRGILGERAMRILMNVRAMFVRMARRAWIRLMDIPACVLLDTRALSVR